MVAPGFPPGGGSAPAESADDEIVARFAATQSMTEIGLGSAIHALRIPLGGHFLSLNQGFLLTLAARACRGRRHAVGATSAIALVASAMKSLSPAGQKLTPMLAIAVQGALYSVGIALFGANLVGAAFGSMLLASWGFAQPLLLAALLFGGTFFSAIEGAWLEIAGFFGIPAEAGPWILVGVLVAKGGIAAAVAVFAWRLDLSSENRYLAAVASLRARFAPPERSERKDLRETRDRDRLRSALRGAFRDLLHPWYLVAFAFTVGFVFLGGSENRRWIAVARTLAASCGVFFALRALPPMVGPAFRRRFPRWERLIAQARVGSSRAESSERPDA